MGYESKVYIVEKSSGLLEGEKKKYAQVVAMFDMCKFGAFDGIFTEETDCFIYAEDGNTEILEDNYGESLKEATIKNVIEYLENYQKNNEYYRRVEPLIGLLKGFNLENWNDLVVLHYGH